MVTTRQNTLYIGWVFETPTISSKKEIRDITIFPMIEGFVHESEHKFFITMSRLDEFDEVPQSIPSKDKKSQNSQVLSNSIVLPTSEITSICNYNVNPYRKLTFIQWVNIKRFRELAWLEHYGFHATQSHYIEGLTSERQQRDDDRWFNPSPIEAKS